MEKKNIKREKPYSLTAYRTLYILLLLMEGQKLSLNEINKKLLENPLIKKEYSYDTLLKNIKTIRLAGYEISRPSHKNDHTYVLTEQPLLVLFSEEELSSSRLLLSLLEQHQNPELYLTYSCLLEKLLHNFKNSNGIQRQLMKEHSVPSKKAIKKQKYLQKYKKLCADKQILKLTYITDENLKKNLEIDPHYIIESNSIFYLVGTEHKTKKGCHVELSQIIETSQLPLKGKTSLHLTLVKFRLLGSLARTFYPYPDDKVISQKNETLIIETKTENTDLLFKRVLGYGSNCIVLSPPNFKKRVKEQIQSLLSLHIIK